jgi:hypothetical protein
LLKVTMPIRIFIIWLLHLSSGLRFGVKNRCFEGVLTFSSKITT